MTRENIAYVYILRCADNTLYTGYTTEPLRRLAEHNQGMASKYTRGRRPVEMVYLEECGSRSEALKREYIIKTFTRKQKEALIKNNPVINLQRDT